MNYFNTTQIESKELYSEIKKAKNQESFIMPIFESNPDKYFTPFDIQQIAKSQGKEMEITSVRRAMTCLTEQGKLIKSVKACFKGKFDKANFGWKFNNGKML